MKIAELEKSLKNGCYFSRLLLREYICEFNPVLLTEGWVKKYVGESWMETAVDRFTIKYILREVDFHMGRGIGYGAYGIVFENGKAVGFLLDFQNVRGYHLSEQDMNLINEDIQSRKFPDLPERKAF